MQFNSMKCSYNFVIHLHNLVFCCSVIWSTLKQNGFVILLFYIKLLPKSYWKKKQLQNHLYIIDLFFLNNRTKKGNIKLANFQFLWLVILLCRQAARFSMTYNLIHLSSTIFAINASIKYPWFFMNNIIFILACHFLYLGIQYI